jgi:hypothetical protein
VSVVSVVVSGLRQMAMGTSRRALSSMPDDPAAPAHDVNAMASTDARPSQRRAGDLLRKQLEPGDVIA